MSRNYRSTKGRQIESILASRISPQPEINPVTNKGMPINTKYPERVANYFKAGISAMSKLSPNELKHLHMMLSPEGHTVGYPDWHDRILATVADGALVLAVSNKMDAAK